MGRGINRVWFFGGLSVFAWGSPDAPCRLLVFSWWDLDQLSPKKDISPTTVTGIEPVALLFVG